MVGIAEAAQLATFLKIAGDMTKAMVGLSNAETIRAQVIELQGVILSAQGSAMSAQSDQFTMVDRIRDLEREIADLKTWAAKKQRYELYKWEMGSFSYRLKEGVQPPEPTHHLCANCYEQGVASLIQPSIENLYIKNLKCNRCSASILTEREPARNPYSGRVTRG